MQLAITIVQLFVCVVIIAIVAFQSGDTEGIGVISGGSDNYLRGKNRGLDAKLTKATKWVALVFVLLTLALNCL